MQDYAVAFTNSSGAFPDILAVNASGPSATDGTEFKANMINDSMWGVMQMLLNLAAMTPNGVVESDSASQVKEALWKGFGAPPGVITEWNLAQDPGTTGHRALLLNGQGILKANYPTLDDGTVSGPPVQGVYVGDTLNSNVAAAGGAYFRADNADGSSPSITGAYLILPESRGVTVRGLDAAASIDPDGAGRFLGDIQIDAFQGHIHYNGISDNSNNDLFIYGFTTDDVPGLAGDNPAIVASAGSWQGLTSVPKTDGVNGTPRTDSESRMYNRSTKFVVWY